MGVSERSDDYERGVCDGARDATDNAHARIAALERELEALEARQPHRGAVSAEPTLSDKNPASVVGVPWSGQQRGAVSAAHWIVRDSEGRNPRVITDGEQIALYRNAGVWQIEGPFVPADQQRGAVSDERWWLVEKVAGVAEAFPSEANAQTFARDYGALRVIEVVPAT